MSDSADLHAHDSEPTDRDALDDSTVSAVRKRPRRARWEHPVLLTVAGAVFGFLVSLVLFLIARDESGDTALAAANDRAEIAREQAEDLQDALETATEQLDVANQQLQIATEQLETARSSLATSEQAREAAESAKSSSDLALRTAEQDLELAESQLSTATEARDLAQAGLIATNNALETTEQTLGQTEEILADVGALVRQSVTATNLANARFIQALVEACPRTADGNSPSASITQDEYDSLSQRAADVANDAFEGDDVEQRIVDLFATLRTECELLPFVTPGALIDTDTRVVAPDDPVSP